MATPTDSYPRTTVPLIAALPVFIIGCVFLEGVWRIVAIVILLLLVAALSGTVGALVRKQRDAKNLT